MPKARYEIIQGIYRIYNSLDESEYIGSSKHILRRISHHFWYLKSGRHTNIYLQRAYDKYSEFFGWSILEIVPNSCDLIKREQWWMDHLHPKYNLVLIAGNSFNSGRTFSDETKHKMRLRLLERLTPEFRSWLSNINKGNTYNLGKTLSEETKRKIGDANRVNMTGRKQSPEHIAKRVATIKSLRINYAKSEKTKEKIAMKQRTFPLRLYNSNDDEFEFYNLTSFCKTHELSYRQMRKLIAGKLVTYKGWRTIESHA